MNGIARALLLSALVSAPWAAGCSGVDIPFATHPYHQLTCRVYRNTCEGTDVGGGCFHRTFVDENTTVCRVLDPMSSLSPEEQGIVACAFAVGDICTNCEADGTCEPGTCVELFVSWESECSPGSTDPGSTPGHPPVMHECPDAGMPDAGPDVDADTDAGDTGPDMDAGVASDGSVVDGGDAGSDAGPCMEHDAGTGGTVIPPTGHHQILSYTYVQPLGGVLIDSSPFRTIDLMTEPAAIAVDGLLWTIDGDGKLRGYDVGPPTPAVAVMHDLASVTPGGIMTVNSFAIYVPPAGTAGDMDDPPAIPIDPPVDFVLALVAADQGIFLFRVRVPDVTLIAEEDRMNVSVATFPADAPLQDQHYTVFGTGDPMSRPSAWITESLGTATRETPLLDNMYTPVSIAIEPLVLHGRVWVGLQSPTPMTSLDRVRTMLGTPLALQDSQDFFGPVQDISGPDEWFDFEGGGVINDALVVLAACPPLGTLVPSMRCHTPDMTGTRLTSFINGNFSPTTAVRRDLDLAGDPVALETVAVGDVLLAFVATASADGSVVTLARPTAISITELGHLDLPPMAEVVDMGAVWPCAAPDTPACSGVIHVVVNY